MSVFGEKNGELPRITPGDGSGTVHEERNVLFLVVGLGYFRQVRRCFPADLLDAYKRDLYVNIFFMCLMYCLLLVFVCLKRLVL